MAAATDEALNELRTTLLTLHTMRVGQGEITLLLKPPTFDRWYAEIGSELTPSTIEPNVYNGLGLRFMRDGRR